LKSKPQPYTAILLAAGEGNRFGDLKQLEKVNGKPLLGRTMDKISEVDWKFDPVLVLGYRAEKIREELDLDGFKVILNQRWKKGMSTSVEAAIRSANPGSRGYFLFLADMPAVPVSAIEKVLERANQGSSIVAPEYSGQRGFPVYLDRKWEDELREEISGDRGARRIIRENREELDLVQAAHEGVLMDVDNHKDLEEIELYLNEEGDKIGL